MEYLGNGEQCTGQRGLETHIPWLHVRVRVLLNPCLGTVDEDCRVFRFLR